MFLFTPPLSGNSTYHTPAAHITKYYEISLTGDKLDNFKIGGT